MSWRLLVRQTMVALSESALPRKGSVSIDSTAQIAITAIKSTRVKADVCSSSGFMAAHKLGKTRPPPFYQRSTATSLHHCRKRPPNLSRDHPDQSRIAG